MPRQNGYNTARQHALDNLQKVDWRHRCENLGLPAPENGKIQFQALGMDLVLDLTNLELVQAPEVRSLKISDQILIYHYLGCDFPLQPTGTFIPFRELPGGQFYWKPFRSRSVDILVNSIQNEIQRLAQNIKPFTGEPVNQGDLGWRFPAIGKIELQLIYYTGDAEFGPAANLLFDACIKRVYCAEDVAVLSSRICLALLK